MRTLVFLLSLILFLPQAASGACPVSGPAGTAVMNHDVLSLLFAKLETCPADVLELRTLLQQDGLTLRPTMVANRGFHNPGAGSFSVFEMATGKSGRAGLEVKPEDFFFGHFTKATSDQVLALAQEPRPGALMVELIAWDTEKKLYNFYELIGAGKKGRWFYRGDSADIAADVRPLHRQADPAKPGFGMRLRCSGCHTNGGPIMKEITLPHNDWWDPSRELPLGGRRPDAAMAEILKSLVPASQLAAAVKSGASALMKSGKLAPKLSLPEQLRPLFCPVELNLASSPVPGDERPIQHQIPAGLFLDGRLGEGSMPASAAAYDQGLNALGFRFPEITRKDADHPWLTPVKALSDSLAVKEAIAKGLVSERFSLAMLAIDWTNPVFSQGRCSLLRLLPATASPGWEDIFLGKLKAEAANNPFAAEALFNLEDPQRTPTWFREQGAKFLGACRVKLSKDGLTPYLELLAQRRAEAAASEISKNPRGQILEPGFRVIFPEPAKPAVPGRLKLNSDCGVVGA